MLTFRQVEGGPVGIVINLAEDPMTIFSLWPAPTKTITLCPGGAYRKPWRPSRRSTLIRRLRPRGERVWLALTPNMGSISASIPCNSAASRPAQPSGWHSDLTQSACGPMRGPGDDPRMPTGDQLSYVSMTSNSWMHEQGRLPRTFSCALYPNGYKIDALSSAQLTALSIVAKTSKY